MLDFDLEEDTEPVRALLEATGSAPVYEVDAGQILRERPDVYAAYYSEFYGPLNDRNSPAWSDRVGGETAEDYARYWFRTYGEASGYILGERTGLGAPAEGYVPTGRTTLDGIPLSKILLDRPDVFQAFFTEYYGPNNDRHSPAWVDRVGGTTVEDYANYWYNAYGKVSGYTPSNAPSTPPDTPASPEADPDPPVDTGPPPEDPSLDPWNHPALFPDWQPPYPGWEPPPTTLTAPTDDGADQPAGPTPQFAMPIVWHENADGGFDLIPVTMEEYARVQGQSLFDDTV